MLSPHIRVPLSAALERGRQNGHAPRRRCVLSAASQSRWREKRVSVIEKWHRRSHPPTPHLSPSAVLKPPRRYAAGEQSRNLWKHERVCVNVHAQRMQRVCGIQAAKLKNDQGLESAYKGLGPSFACLPISFFLQFLCLKHTLKSHPTFLTVAGRNSGCFENFMF